MYLLIQRCSYLHRHHLELRNAYDQRMWQPLEGMGGKKKH